MGVLVVKRIIKRTVKPIFRDYISPPNSFVVKTSLGYRFALIKSKVNKLTGGANDE